MSAELSRANANLWLQVMVVFSLLFLPLAVLGNWVYRYQIEVAQERLHEEFIRDLETSALIRSRSGESLLRLILADAELLSTHADLRDYINHADSSHLDDLLSELKRFGEVRSLYDQVRLIDREGFEVLRLDLEGGQMLRTHQDELQDKSNRYYVKDGLQLQPGQLLMTFLDLNIEQGQLEWPLKPMIRFVWPIWDDNGVRWGSVVVNFLAQNLLDIYTVTDYPSIRFSLSDQNGNWLAAPEPEESFGNFVGDRSEYSLAQRFPEAAELFSDPSVSLATTSEGIFLRRQIDPFQLSFLAVPGHQVNLVPSGDPLPEPYYWNLIGWVPQAEITAKMQPLLNGFQRDALVSTALVFLATLAVAFLTVQRREGLRLIRYLARYDELTSLPNRHVVEEHLDYAAKRVARNHKQVAGLFIDLDGFKAVNDRHGHNAGDTLLAVIASRLRAVCRESELVARLGGDEFFILVEDVDDFDGLKGLANRLISAVSQPVIVNSAEVVVGCSIGIAVYPEHTDKIHNLISVSDTAMYRAKQQGKGQVVFA